DPQRISGRHDRLLRPRRRHGQQEDQCDQISNDDPAFPHGDSPNPRRPRNLPGTRDAAHDVITVLSFTQSKLVQNLFTTPSSPRPSWASLLTLQIISLV